MISLFNVIKRGEVVFTDDVYTVELKEPERIMIPDVRPQISVPADGGIDEEAVWNRLKIRLEEERKEVVAEAQKEAGFIRNQAYIEGFEKGAEEKKAAIQALITKAEKLLSDMEETVAAKLREYENDLLELSVEIASKVLARKLDEDDRCMVDLIKKAVEEAKNSEWISVKVSGEMKQILGELEEELRKSCTAGKLDVSVKEAPKGTCVVESPNGIIDASVWTQLENLKSLIS